MNHHETASFIEKFESGTLKQDEWHHREHLVLALWYLTSFDTLTAIMKIKAGILYYNVLYQVPQGNGRGYHETITMFFIRLVQNFISNLDHSISWEEKVSLLTQKYPDHVELLRQNYSRDVLNSSHSRVYWVEPDLRSEATLS